MSRTAQHRWQPVAELAFDSDRLAVFHASTPEARREGFLELAWPTLHANGVSWIGFYLEDPNAPETQRLVLGASRGGPACSPIGLHGACGQAFGSGRPLLVHDVAELGDDYIACDPRDRSELVIPITSAGQVIGVLDVDSHAIGAFSNFDLETLCPLMALLGLTDAPGPA
ncbi:MAG: GAF domain-containing protein [Phycisphaerales bacterium]|nr:GAF domain-containing protein [Phycisphaerales bacterium]